MHEEEGRKEGWNGRDERGKTEEGRKKRKREEIK